MTNDQAAEQYRLTHHSQADNDFQNAMNIAVWKAYVAGCEWKDQQFKQFLTTLKFQSNLGILFGMIEDKIKELSYDNR